MNRRLSVLTMSLAVVLFLLISGCGSPASVSPPAGNAAVQTTGSPAATTQNTTFPPATTRPATTQSAAPPQTGIPDDVKFEILMASPASYAGKTVTTSGAVTSKGTGYVMIGALKCETNSDLSDILTGTLVYATGVCQVNGSSVTLNGALVALIC